jgi:hypothetical protein
VFVQSWWAPSINNSHLLVDAIFQVPLFEAREVISIFPSNDMHNNIGCTTHRKFFLGIFYLNRNKVFRIEV